MNDVMKKLRLIMEGASTEILLEAPEDKYNMEPANDDDTSTVDNAADNVEPDTTEGEDDNTDETTDSSTEDTTDTTDTADDGGGYELDDPTEGGDNEPTTTDTVDDTGSDTPLPDSNEPKPGEVLDIDPKTRSILAFKNFDKYRDLRDDTSRLVSELSEFVSINDDIRSVVNTTIEKGNDLVNKLTDYIQYKYISNSYEINYYNFIQFLLEKRYLNELFDKIIQTSSQSKTK